MTTQRLPRPHTSTARTLHARYTHTPHDTATREEQTRKRAKQEPHRTRKDQKHGFQPARKDDPHHENGNEAAIITQTDHTKQPQPRKTRLLQTATIPQHLKIRKITRI
jgi:hypothetical protein